MKLIKAKKYLCMLLAAMLVSAAAIGVNAEELITGVGDWLIDIGISEDSIDDYPVEDELVPQAATACPTITKFKWAGSHHTDHLDYDPEERDKDKDYHSVFSAEAAGAIYGFSPMTADFSYTSYGNRVYGYHYPNAGRQYGKKGNGEVCNSIFIVTNGNSEYVYTAYPVYNGS